MGRRYPYNPLCLAPGFAARVSKFPAPFKPSFDVFSAENGRLKAMLLAPANGLEKAF